MRLRTFRLALLPALLPLLLIASGCATRVSRVPIFPPVADMRTVAKPMPTPDIATDDRAAADYSIAIEAWGEDGWRAVARICRWAVANGAALPFSCPQPEAR